MSSRTAPKLQTEKPVPLASLPGEPGQERDVVPKLLSQAQWVNLLEQEEGEQVVADIVTQLVDNVMDRFYRIKLKEQLVPFVVCQSRDTLVQLMKYAFLQRDEADQPQCEDCEAQTCVIDSWATGGGDSAPQPSPQTQNVEGSGNSLAVKKKSHPQSLPPKTKSENKSQCLYKEKLDSPGTHKLSGVRADLLPRIVHTKQKQKHPSSYVGKDKQFPLKPQQVWPGFQVLNSSNMSEGFSPWVRSKHAITDLAWPAQNGCKLSNSQAHL